MKTRFEGIKVNLEKLMGFHWKASRTLLVKLPSWIVSWKTNAVSGKQAVLFWDNGNFQFETAAKTEEISICGCLFFSSLKSGFQSALMLCDHHFQISSFKKSPYENTSLVKKTVYYQKYNNNQLLYLYASCNWWWGRYFATQQSIANRNLLN